MNQALAQAQTLATHTLTSTTSFISAFFAVLVLAAAFFLFARYVGRGQFVAFLISLYTGYALYSIFPFMSSLPSAPASTALIARLVLFAVLSFVTYLVLRRIVVSDFLSIGTLGLVALSLLGAGFLLALAYQVFSARDVYTFTPSVDALFAAKTYFFWWIAGPLIGLFAFAR